jgi:tetratricopeptide (TPR) repeat protein
LAEAEAVLSQARERFPDSVELLAEWGLLCRALEREPEAIAALSEAVQRQPNQLEWQLRLGEVCNAAEEWEAALEPLEAATRQPEWAPEAWRELTRAREELEDWPAALKSAERWRAIDPTSPQPGLAAARCWVAEGELERARDELTRAIALDPQEAETWRARSEVLQRLGKAEQSQADAKRAEEVERARELDKPPEPRAE